MVEIGVSVDDDGDAAVDRQSDSLPAAESVVAPAGRRSRRADHGHRRRASCIEEERDVEHHLTGTLHVRARRPCRLADLRQLPDICEARKPRQDAPRSGQKPFI